MWVVGLVVAGLGRLKALEQVLAEAPHPPALTLLHVERCKQGSQ